MAKPKSDDNIYAPSTAERGTYSKTNPHGPYQSNSRPSLGAGNDDGAKPTYREGFSTKRDLADWAARATANSFPASLPPGNKGLGSPKSHREDRDGSTGPRQRIGWTPERE